MATNVNISVPTFEGEKGNLLTLDKAIRAAIRASLQSKERTPKIEKKVESETSSPKGSASIKTRRDPGAVRKKKEQPLIAGSGATNQEEENNDGGGGGDPTPGIPYLIIVNVNQAKDDVFDIYLNGIKLSGRCNFSFDNERTAYLFVWDSQFAQTIRNFSPEYYFRETFLQSVARPTLGASVTMLMENVQANGNGNYGLYYAGIFNPSNSSKNEVSDSWGPGDGENETIVFTWPTLLAA